MLTYYPQSAGEYGLINGLKRQRTLTGKRDFELLVIQRHSCIATREEDPGLAPLLSRICMVRGASCAVTSACAYACACQLVGLTGHIQCSATILIHRLVWRAHWHLFYLSPPLPSAPSPPPPSSSFLFPSSSSSSSSSSSQCSVVLRTVRSGQVLTPRPLLLHLATASVAAERLSTLLYFAARFCVLSCAIEGPVLTSSVYGEVQFKSTPFYSTSQ
jgi:hypothetical protein